MKKQEPGREKGGGEREREEEPHHDSSLFCLFFVDMLITGSNPNLI